MSVKLSKPPYGEAYAGRGLRVVRQVEEKLSDGSWAGKDIGAARFTYRIRAFNESVSPRVLIYDKPISKSTTAATTGWLDYYFPLGVTAYPVLRWEWIEVDNDNTDASTPTTRSETVIEEWHQDVKTKPPTS